MLLTRNFTGATVIAFALSSLVACKSRDYNAGAKSKQDPATQMSHIAPGTEVTLQGIVSNSVNKYKNYVKSVCSITVRTSMDGKVDVSLKLNDVAESIGNTFEASSLKKSSAPRNPGMAEYNVGDDVIRSTKKTVVVEAGNDLKVKSVTAFERGESQGIDLYSVTCKVEESKTASGDPASIKTPPYIDNGKAVKLTGKVSNSVGTLINYIHTPCVVAISRNGDGSIKTELKLNDADKSSFAEPILKKSSVELNGGLTKYNIDGLDERNAKKSVVVFVKKEDKLERVMSVTAFERAGDRDVYSVTCKFD